MKSPFFLVLVTLFLFNNFSATAKANTAVVCVADAGEDLVLTCTATCVDLNSSGSSTGSDVVYTWTGPGITSANENDPFPNVCEPGVYTLTVEDLVENCSETDEVIVMVDQEAPIADAGPDVSMDCWGGVALDGSGSSPDNDISYEWYDSNGSLISNQVFVTIIDPGNYTLVVTNFNNGCTESDEVIVSDNNNPPNLILVGNTFIECNSGSTTLITAVASGGIPPYDYLWNNGFNGEALDVGQGLYIVTVSDSNGCTSVAETTVTSDNIVVDFTLLQQATCGGCDGALDVTVTGGGGGPFNFDWNDDSLDGQEDPVTFCENEFYQLVVYNTDSTCVTTQSTDIFFAFNNIGIQTTSTNATCDDNNGTATATVSFGGGTDPSFLWCNGQTTATATDLPAGLCSVVVTNNTTGCTGEQSVAINQAPALNLAISGNLVIECNAGTTTTLTASITGGTAPYTYLWNNANGSSTQSLDVGEGVYTVTVTDSNGCTVVDEVTVVNDNIILDYTVVQEATCGGCDGAVDIAVTGGQGGTFNFDWNDDTLDGQEDPVTLCENTLYQVNVYNADSSCAVLLTIDDFFAFSNIEIEVESTYASCGNDDGTATVTVISGAPDPSFIWSNGETEANQTDLAPGGYSVTVVNNTTGCGTHQNIIIEEDPVCNVHISGYVYNDNTNEDCDPATADEGVYNIMVTLDNGDITFTDVDGYYQFDVDPGTYEVNINLTTPQYLDLCTDAITVDLQGFGEVSENNNFFIINAQIQDLNIKVVKWNARPGFQQHIIICAMNFGEEPASGTVVFVHDSISDLVNTTGPSTAIYDEPAHTVSWEFEDLPPGAVWVYHAYLYHDQDVPLGTNLDYYFALEPIIGDIDPTNNVIECSMVVTGSYDPNDKRAIPGGEEEQGYTHPTDSLINYTIRFQNTGTDTAFTVVILDTLDLNFDINSVVALPSCRPYKLDVLDDRVLEFTFENILLPDSTTNEPESHGFVMYDVKMVSGLPMGTPIENTAAIYFDYNQPIITNTTLHTLSNRRVDVTGVLQTENGQGIQDVSVTLASNILQLPIEASEVFEFINVPTETDYSIVALKDDDQLNGISSYDLVLIQKHILQTDILNSPYKILAADVNNSGSVTGIDMIELRKLILHIDEELQYQNSWRFLDEDFVFPNPMNPFESIFPGDANSSEVSISHLLYDYNEADFVVVKIGDVNNTVNPLMGAAEVHGGYSGELLIKVEDQNLEKGKDYALRFNTSDLNNLVSCQFTLSFDPQHLEFLDFEKGTLSNLSTNNLGLTHLEEGVITFSWNGNPTEFTGEANLFNLKFKSKRATTWKETIQINSSYTEKEAYRQGNEQAQQLDVVLLFEKSEESLDVNSAELIVYPNHPNPFKKETMISFHLPEGELVDLIVFDVNGKVVKRHQGFFEKGFNSYNLDKTIFDQSGLYYYQVKTKEKSVLQKMLYVK